MKKFILAFTLVCSMWNIFGQAPPILRNDFTTNNNVVARGAVTNIAQSLISGGSVTNAISTVKTNNVLVTNGVTVLELTNSGNVTFSATAVGNTVKVSASSTASGGTNSAGFGQVNPGQLATNANTLTITNYAPISNLVVRSTFSDSTALAVNTNLIVATNGLVGINKNPTSFYTLDVGGFVNIDRDLTVGGTIIGANNFDDGFNKLFQTPTKLLFEGDSITQGGGAGGVGWAYYLTNIYAFSNITYLNKSVSSSTLSIMSDRNSPSNNPCGAGTNGYYFCWIGINDVLFSNLNVNPWMTGLENNWGQAHSNGYKVVAIVPTSANQGGGFNNQQQTNYDGICNNIRTNALVDYLVDAALIAPMFAAPTNFVDALHPTNSASLRVAEAALDVLMNGTNGNRVRYVGLDLYAGRLNGDGSNIFNINATNITRGLVPALRLPTNTLVTAGSGATVTPSSSGGVQSYVVSVPSVASTPSAYSKRTWQHTPNESAAQISYYGALMTLGGSAAGDPALDFRPYSHFLYTTAVASNNSYYVENTLGLITNRAWTLVFMLAVSNITNVRVEMGASVTPSAFAEDPNNAALTRERVMFMLNTNGNWSLFSSLVATVRTNVDTGIAANTNAHIFRIDCSPTQATGYIDGVSVATNTLGIPSTTAMKWFMGVNTLTTEAKGIWWFQSYGEQAFP